ncbi:MAG: T9SS type A sorting domain-containing protein, partial [Bacteroidia bacterium]|nr:T9SS type A sorting domain-containing protein [Bacteroidia bacterium]
GPSTTILFDSQWHLLVGVCDSNLWQIWVDGVLENQLNTNHINNSIHSNDPLCFGKYNEYNMSYFLGDMDDIRIYNRILNSSEILALYNETVPSNKISGLIFNDLNGNCLKDVNENPLINIIIKTEPGNFYGISDTSGNYHVFTDTGTHQIKQVIPEVISPMFSNQNCPNNPEYYTISFDSLGFDTCCFDFANIVTECPILTVDVSSDRRRRCFTNNTYVFYCNIGQAEADNVEVIVEFPEFVKLNSANYSYTINGESNFVFNIGALSAGECGTIHIIDSVSCITDITGLTQCTKAWILPENDCLYQLQDTSAVWDHSSVMVTGSCIQDSIAYFLIINTGDPGEGNMQGSSEYRIFADGVLAQTGTFQLAGGDSLELIIDAKGATIRVEADQRPGHPGNSHPNDVVEACGTNVNGSFSMGFITQQPVDDDNVAIAEDCQEIRDSYDPNDKQIVPSGITENHYVQPGTMLNFTIRFQNTGTDTAYKAVIIDTLSSVFDISSLQFIAGSHPYQLDVTGQNSPILKFTFNNINLPDSITDETNSHGFVKFAIAPFDTLPFGTLLMNFTDIYFDFNLPVRTNTAWVIISDTIPSGATVTLLDDIPFGINSMANMKSCIDIYPNPANDHIIIDYGDYSTMSGYTLKITNLYGQVVFATPINQQQSYVELNILYSNGIYFVHLIDAQSNTVNIRKIVIQ